jgi:hypothetical protein
MKPREFWIFESDAYNFDEIEPIEGAILVREVIPGTVTISREEFRKACGRAENDDDVEYFDVRLERQLFGKD